MHDPSPPLDASTVTQPSPTATTEEWVTDTGDQPQHCSPAVGSHLYLGGLGSAVTALDSDTGDEAWTRDRAGALSDSSPAVADGTVYIGSGGGVLYALTESSGDVRWKHATNSAIVSSPTVAGDTVYVGTNDGRVLALGTSGGAVEWGVSVGAAVYSRPAVGDGAVAVTTSDGRVVALEAGDGGERWSADTDVDLMHSSPTVSDGLVYVAADRVYAWDANTRELQWAESYSGNTAASPVVASGAVYVGGAGGVSAFDATTGTTNWSVETEAPVETAPAVAGDSVVAAAGDGTVWIIDAETGSVSPGTTVGSAVRGSMSNGADAVYLWTADGQLRKLRVDGNSYPDKQRWSDPATWDGEKPGQDDAVEITEEMDVVLDESPPELEGIHIDGGTLTFARQDLAVTTGYIVVTDGGRLQIGTEDEPFEQEATITLTGEDDIGSAAVPTEHCGVKTVCSLGGKLSIHGAVEGPTWTNLAATAEAGAETLTLNESVDWEVGGEIVVTASSYDPALAERRTITAVNGTTVELDEPLEFQHYGEMQYYGENDQYRLDERAEVMHLSRNVLIQGDEASENDRFGGHVIAMNQHHDEQMRRANDGEDFLDLWEEMDNDESLVPEIDGVEFNRMGQEGVMGRYPFHWHTYGDASGSYVSNSSFHNSYQRGVTVHGTQNVRLENNVAFNVVGHCYFLEDGTEWNNEITNNIGALVKSFSSEEQQLQARSDAFPSVFWWSHPDNRFVDNVAAGAYGFGFWLESKPHPTGLTATDKLQLSEGVPKDDDVSFGTFSNNTAHSTMNPSHSADGPPLKNDVKNPGGIGLMVGGNLHSEGRDDAWFKGAEHTNPDGPRCDFTNNTYYYNDGAGVWMNSQHSYTRSVNSTFADNGLGGRWGVAHEEGNVFIALSDNPGNPGKRGTGLVDGEGINHVDIETLRKWEKQVGRSLPTKRHQMLLGKNGVEDFEGQIPITGMDWQYDGAITKDNVFINYNDREHFNAGAMTMPSNGKAFVTLTSEMVDSTEPYMPHSGGETVFRDIDGTLTGTGEYTEIRQDSGKDKSTSALLDETCTKCEDRARWDDSGNHRFYYLCTSTTAEFERIRVDGDSTSVTHRESGLEVGAELPAASYEIDETVSEEVYFRINQMSTDHEWVFALDAPSPLNADPVDTDHQASLDDSRWVTRVTSKAEFDSTAEKFVTLYYDEETGTEYVKLRGNASYDKAVDEFYYYNMGQKPAPARFWGSYRVKLEVADK